MNLFHQETSGLSTVRPCTRQLQLMVPTHQAMKWLCDNCQVCHCHIPGAPVNVVHLEVVPATGLHHVWTPEKLSIVVPEALEQGQTHESVIGGVLLVVVVVQVHTQSVASSWDGVGLQGPRHAPWWPVGPLLTLTGSPDLILDPQEMFHLVPLVCQL